VAADWQITAARRLAVIQGLLSPLTAEERRQLARMLGTVLHGAGLGAGQARRVIEAWWNTVSTSSSADGGHRDYST
jgi:hypothetical protein